MSLFFVNCERTVLFSVKRDLDPPLPPSLRCCMNNSGKFFCNSSFTGEPRKMVNLERWKDTDVSLLITTYVDNKCFFGGKGTKKVVFEIIAEQFTKGIWSFGEATERGL